MSKKNGAIEVLEHSQEGDFWMETISDNDDFIVLKTFNDEMTAQIDEEGNVMLSSNGNCFVIKDISSFADAILNLEDQIQANLVQVTIEAEGDEMDEEKWTSGA